MHTVLRKALIQYFLYFFFKYQNAKIPKRCQYKIVKKLKNCDVNNFTEIKTIFEINFVVRLSSNSGYLHFYMLFYNLI